MVFIVLMISRHTFFENFEIQKSGSLYLKIISYIFIAMSSIVPRYLIFSYTFRLSFIQTIRTNVASDFLVIYIKTGRLNLVHIT